jgi:hypothetical protein
MRVRSSCSSSRTDLRPTASRTKGGKLGAREWLRQEVRRTEPTQTKGVQGCGHAADRDHCRSRRLQSHGLQHVKRVTVWQAHVEHDDIRLPLLYLAGGLCGRGAYSHLRLLTGQGCGQRLGEGWVVIDHQDLPALTEEATSE